MISESYKPVLTADIGVRLYGAAQDRKIIAVLHELFTDCFIRNNSAFQFDIDDLILFDLKKIEFFSESGNLIRIKETQRIYVIHVCHQSMHQRLHTFQFPFSYFQKVLSV